MKELTANGITIFINPALVAAVYGDGEDTYIMVAGGIVKSPLDLHSTVQSLFPQQ